MASSINASLSCRDRKHSKETGLLATSLVTTLVVDGGWTRSWILRRKMRSSSSAGIPLRNGISLRLCSSNTTKRMSHIYKHNVVFVWRNWPICKSWSEINRCIGTKFPTGGSSKLISETLSSWMRRTSRWDGAELVCKKIYIINETLFILYTYGVTCLPARHHQS